MVGDRMYIHTLLISIHTLYYTRAKIRVLLSIYLETDILLGKVNCFIYETFCKLKLHNHQHFVQFPIDVTIDIMYT